jgi:ABC-2 type transport system permease protein
MIARVFRYELFRQFRRNGYRFFTFAVPVLAVVIYMGVTAVSQARANQPPDPDAVATDDENTIGGGGLNGVTDVRPTGIVDLSGLMTTRIAGLVPYESVGEAQTALANNEIGAYYVIAQDYFVTGEIDLYFERFNLGNVNNNPVRQLIVSSLVNQATTGADMNYVMRLQQRNPTIVEHTVGTAGQVREEASEEASFLLLYVFAMMLTISAFTTSGYMMQSVVEEKENRMVEVLLSSLRPRDLLAGKIFALGLLGFLQMFLWGVAAYFILSGAANSLVASAQIGAAIPNPFAQLNVTLDRFVLLMIYFVLGYLLFAACYAAIGALATNMREGPQLALVITLPASIPLYATSIFAATPNAAAPVFMSIFPVTAPMAMVMRIAVTNVPFEQIALSVGLLTLTVIGAIATSCALSRNGDDLYFQP